MTHRIMYRFLYYSLSSQTGLEQCIGLFS